MIIDDLAAVFSSTCKKYVGTTRRKAAVRLSNWLLSHSAVAHGEPATRAEGPLHNAGFKCRTAANNKGKNVQRGVCSLRRKPETAAICRGLQRVQFTHLGQAQSYQTASLALFQALKTFKLQPALPATLTLRTVVLRCQHRFKDQQYQRQKRMSCCRKFSRQARSTSGKFTLIFSSVSINQTQSKALEHLQHDCYRSLSNHVVVCPKSTHFFRSAAFGLHYLCVTAPGFCTSS